MLYNLTILNLVATIISILPICVMFPNEKNIVTQINVNSTELNTIDNTSTKCRIPNKTKGRVLVLQCTLINKIKALSKLNVGDLKDYLTFFKI